MGSTAAEIEAALAAFAAPEASNQDKHMQDHIESEAPEHKVILTKPMYLGVHEITQAQY